MNMIIPYCFLPFFFLLYMPSLLSARSRDKREGVCRRYDDTLRPIRDKGGNPGQLFEGVEKFVRLS